MLAWLLLTLSLGWNWYLLLQLRDRKRRERFWKGQLRRLQLQLPTESFCLPSRN